MANHFVLQIIFLQHLDLRGSNRASSMIRHELHLHGHGAEPMHEGLGKAHLQCNDRWGTR